MRDPEAARQAAHIVLDALTVHSPDDDPEPVDRDAMSELALQRLTEVGALTLTRDEAGRYVLDVAGLSTGLLAVTTVAVSGWARCAGIDRDVLIAEIRAVIDAHLTDEVDV